MKIQTIRYESPTITVAQYCARKYILNSSTFSGSTTDLDDDYGGFSGDTPGIIDDSQ